MNDIIQSIEIMKCTKESNERMIADASDKKLFGKAIDDAISALEKQIPKKPKNIRNIAFNGSVESNFSKGECPNCGEYVDTDDNKYVCGKIGCYQAIDWSVEE